MGAVTVVRLPAPPMTAASTTTAVSDMTAADARAPFDRHTIARGNGSDDDRAVAHDDLAVRLDGSGDACAVIHHDGAGGDERADQHVAGGNGHAILDTPVGGAEFAGLPGNEPFVGARRENGSLRRFHVRDANDIRFQTFEGDIGAQDDLVDRPWHAPS